MSSEMTKDDIRRPKYAFAQFSGSDTPSSLGEEVVKKIYQIVDDFAVGEYGLLTGTSSLSPTSSSWTTRRK